MDADTQTVVETPPAGMTPGMSAARERSLDMLEQHLPHEQAVVLKEQRKSKAKAKAPPAPAVAEAASVEKAVETPSTPAVEEKPAAVAEEETLTMGDDPAPATDEQAPDAEAAPEEITEEELAKLNGKARKAYLDANKEAAKVRKRAQEAEANLKEREAKLTERDEQIKAMTEQLADLSTRGAALASNEFGTFQDGKAVGFLGNQANKGLTLLEAHQDAVAKGRAEADAEIPFTIHQWDATEGKWVEEEIDLNNKRDVQRLNKRVSDAQTWFEVDGKVSANRDEAKKITERYTGTKGYTEALDSYRKDAAIHTRLDELMSKAALYDTLMARKATIKFPDTAGTAIKVPSATARTPEPAASNKRTAPPSESSASAPRMAASMNGDDDASRKSQLMEQARTATSYDQQQKYLKQAAMIPSASRTFAKQGSRSTAA